MNTQQTFDFIIAHLRKQKAQALGPLGDCSYLTPEGTSCAVGCLLGGLSLESDQNTCSVEELVELSAEASLLLEDIDLDFLTDMQDLHDSTVYYGEIGFTDAGERKIEFIADRHHLTTTETP